MKSIAVVIGSILCAAVLTKAAQAQDFYYFDNVIYPVTVSDSEITVQFQDPLPNFDIGAFVNRNGCLTTSVPPEGLEQGCVQFALSTGCSYATAAAAIGQDPDVKRVLPVYHFPSGYGSFAVTDLVSVQFDESLAQPVCENILASFGLHRVDSSEYVHNYWWCALDDTIPGSPLAIGNELHLLPETKWASATMYARAEFQSQPDDEYYQFQYYLRNTGQTGGTLDADIDADLAWNITTGGVRIALLDDGWSAHPDLPEPRVQGVWNVGDWNPKNGPPIGNSNATPRERDNHGMATAGIIAAAHNGIGIAGICPECQLIGIKIARSIDGKITRQTRALVNAIHIAYALGADVISNSWSYNTIDPLTDIAEAIRYVADPCRPSGGWHGGVAVIFSSGNYADKFLGPSKVTFPANMTETIAVGGINKSNGQWSYSNFGDSLDLVAPTGLDGDPMTGVPRGDVWTDDQLADLGWNPLVTGVIGDADDHDYTFRMGGTSASCAMVSGITALLLSRRPDLLNGCAPYETIRKVLDSSAVDLGDPGNDPLYGFGRANAYRALLSVIRGDLTVDGVTDSADLNALIDLLFFNGQAPLDDRIGDLNCDGFLDSSDLNVMIQIAFFNNPPLPPCFAF